MIDFREIPTTPPPRLTIREVCDISGLSKNTIASMRDRGEFPNPIYRCKHGQVFNGIEVYKALGFTVETKGDPFNVEF